MKKVEHIFVLDVNKMRTEFEIDQKIAYVRTMLLINPNDFFRRGQLENLLWLKREIRDSRAFKQWKRMIADNCQHFTVDEHQFDDTYISTVCIDCGKIIDERLV